MLDEKPTRGRRLASLMFTDMVGYSALSAKDELLSVQLVTEQRAIIDKLVPLFGGSRTQYIGDGCFMEFGSAVDSVLCAREIQTRIRERNLSAPADHQIQIRIGIHIGDIIDFDGSTYGDSINIASRIENQANPGGIYVTRQVYDQVFGSIQGDFETVGKIPLKNIPRPVEVFRLKLPWEETQTVRSFTGVIRQIYKNLTKEQFSVRAKSLSLIGLTAVILPCLALTLLNGAQNLKVNELQSEELEGQWQYSFMTAKHTPSPWQDYDPSFRYTYAQNIRDKYWLRLLFQTKNTYDFPSLVIGQLSKGNTLYLNGHPIGQGNQFEVVQSFFIEPHFLNAGGTNELIIQSGKPQNGRLGFYAIPELGLKIGEAEYLNNRTLAREFTWYSARAIYMVMALIMFFAFGIYLIQGRNRAQAVYGALFFALMTLLLSYYNQVLTSSLAETTRILIKSVALAGSSFVLFSAFLSATSKNKFETWNNWIGLISVSILVAAMFPGQTDLFVSLIWQHRVLHFTLAYSLVWIAYAVWKTHVWVISERHKQSSWKPQTAERLIPIMLAIFSFVLIWTALRNGYSPIAIQEPLRESLRDSSQTMQFVFGLFTIAGACVTYLMTNSQLSSTKKRDEILLSLSRLMGSTPSIKEAISLTQERVAKFVQAERSTLYLVSEESGTLVSLFLQGSLDATRNVAKELIGKDGPVGYVYDTRSPLISKDVTADIRFKNYFAHRETQSSYQSGACMILPLLFAGKVVGVITVADPKDRHEFTNEEFFLMQLIAGDLAVLITAHGLEKSLARVAA